MQFEINDQSYFLNYVEDEGRWYVFQPTGSGVIRIPVEMEAIHSEHFALWRSSLVLSGFSSPLLF